MIIPDINLLIYAYDSLSPYHGKCKQWWESCLSGAEPVGIPDVVAFGFVRLCTNARAFGSPMSVKEVLATMRSWLEQPNCQVLPAGPDHIEDVFKLLDEIGTAGNMVSDAQLAAVAIEHGAVLHTADTDFMRFQKLRTFNPLGRTSSSSRQS